jgi:hypothetical protein
MNVAVRCGRRPGRCVALALFVAGAGALGSVACSRAPKPPAEGAEPLPPVAPPPNLLAEGAIATPDATWQRFQRGAGGGAGLLPSTLGGLVCIAAGLDARLGGEISGTSPAYLVVAGEPASPSWVLAARLVEERRARPLFEGASAIFDAKDAGGGVLELSPKGRPAREGGFVGVAVGGWVVVGSSDAALGELAPYATRSLPAKGPPAEAIAIDIAQSALAGAIADAVAREWSDAERVMLEQDRALREAHGGRAPDFGDPRAIVGALDGWVEKKLGALRDLRGAHVGVSVGSDDVRVVLTASPASAGGAASAIAESLRPGDIAPLASVPRETVLALLTRDDAAARARDAADLEGALRKTLGPRLTPADARKINSAIEDWSGARGDWATIALTLTPTDRGALADVAANDPARASRAVREGIDLLAHVPAMSEPFEALFHVHRATLSTPEVPGGGRASMATFATEASSPLSLAWLPGASRPAPGQSQSPQPGDLKLALGSAPLSLLAPPPPRGAAGDDALVRAALGSVGPVAVALLVQPGRLPGCSATGAIVAAWGVRPGAQGGKELWGTLVASDSSLRCAAKSFF